MIKKNPHQDERIGKRVRYIREGRDPHKGVIVAVTNVFAKVYDDSKNSSDASAETAEWLPIKGKSAWIEGL